MTGMRYSSDNTRFSDRRLTSALPVELMSPAVSPHCILLGIEPRP